MPATPNFNWFLPTDGADDDAWGGELNTDTFASIDADVWAIKGTADAAMPKAGGVSTGNVDNLTERYKLNTLTATGAVDLDLSLGQYWVVTVTGNTTITFKNAQAGAGYAEPIAIRFINPGAFTLAFAGGTFKLGAAGAPAWTISGVDMFYLVTEDAGTTYRLAGLLQNVTA